MWFVRSSNVIQPNCRKQLRGLWVEGVRGSPARLEKQAEQSRPIPYVDLIRAPPLLPNAPTYTTFIYGSWSLVTGQRQTQITFSSLVWTKENKQ